MVHFAEFFGSFLVFIRQQTTKEKTFDAVTHYFV